MKNSVKNSIFFLLFFCVSFIGFAQADLGKLRERYMQAINSSNTEEASKLALQMAERYRQIGDNTNASMYFSEAIERFASYHNDATLATCYLSLAEISQQNVEYESALLSYQRAGKHYRLAKDRKGYLKVQLGAINIFIKQKQAKKALGILKESSNLAAAMEDNNLLAQCYGLYVLAYEQTGNKEKELEYRKMLDEIGGKVQVEKMKEMEAQIQNEKNKQYATIHEKEKALRAKDKTIAQIEEQQKRTQQRLSEEEKQIEELNKEKKLKELEFKQIEYEEKLILLVLAIVAVILLAIIILSIFMFKAYKDKRNANKQLAFQNDEITKQREALAKQGEELSHILTNVRDSIRYAQKIQIANLPSKEEVNRYIPENFIVYKPKDVVSGDFYWFAVESTEKQTQIFYAVGDCTGHGVPGAFMAMIGITFLKEVVNQKHSHNPANILAYMHLGIRKALQQEDNANDDGIDIALCMFEKQDIIQTKITFAGAKRPLYVCENSKITTIKGDAKSVGGKQKEAERIFNNHVILVQKGTMIYLTSDGYADQNNLQNEKIGSQKLIDLLAENSMLSMNTQKQALEDVLKNHQGTQHQRDDITIAGIRI